MQESILNEYDTQVPLYKIFCDRLANLIIEILDDQKINYHSVTSRVKQKYNLSKKLQKSTGKYTSLADVTDIAGIRVITYFEDDVDKIAQIIQEEFSVDIKNSIDKRALLDPDRFGYLSMHHVVALHPKRCKLPEYKKFPKLKAEIQTRSILQHAWAEIEHDLGYKTKKGIPKSIRRNFSRLAGLLEIADKEFFQIRNELARYEETVTREMERNPEAVSIDLISLESFISTNKMSKELDQAIAKACHAKPKDTTELLGVDDYDVEGLYCVRIETISQLEYALSSNKDLIIKFAVEWLKSADEKFLKPGIAIFYLKYILAARTYDINKIEKYLVISNIHEEHESIDDIADDVLKTYRHIKE